MARKRKTHSAAFKAQVALAAIKGDRTLNEIASHFDVHPTLVNDSKKRLHHGPEALFSGPLQQTSQAEVEALQAELFEQIGRLKRELEWLKKNSPMSAEAKRALIESGHPRLSVRRRCELLGLCRASLYDEPVPQSEETLRLMALIDRQYTDCPFYGSRRMTAWLRGEGHEVNRKRVRRLLGLMGIEAIYPRPRLSASERRHKVYPYLLRGVAVERPDQVWSSAITYVGLPGGFLYLAAVIDWYSRYVISWRLSNTLDGDFCLEMLDEALTLGKPEGFNTDQGVQFTASAWTERLLCAGVAVSMDGVGRCLDNVFVQRLWRTVKYEELYLKRYEAVPELHRGLAAYLVFSNERRLHQSLGYRTPQAVYHEARRTRAG